VRCVGIRRIQETGWTKEGQEIMNGHSESLALKLSARICNQPYKKRDREKGTDR